MKSNAPIDVLRFLIAFMVVAIHCGLSDLNVNVYNIFQSAVPLFFVISGYFIENKRAINNRGGYIDDYILKSCRLYFYWTVIYLPLTIYGCIKNDYTWWRDVIFSLHGFLIKGENYYSWPLWYLLAVIYAAYMYRYMLIHKWSNRKMIIFTILLTSIGFALEYCSNIKLIKILLLIIGGTRNGIFQGFSYLMIGVFISRYNIPTYIRNNKMIVYIVWLMLLPICGYFPVTKSLFIDHIMSGLLITLLLALNFRIQVDTKPLRLVGVWMYFIHMYVVFFIRQFNGIRNFIECFLYALPISFCLAVFLYFLSQKNRKVGILIAA